LAGVLRHKGELKKAAKTLEVAFDMVKSSEKSLSDQRLTPVEFGQADKMTLYMEMIALYRQLGRTDEANTCMQDALNEFKVSCYNSV